MSSAKGTPYPHTCIKRLVREILKNHRSSLKLQFMYCIFLWRRYQHICLSAHSYCDEVSEGRVSANVRTTGQRDMLTNT